jgi:hypothetical protein
MDVSLKTGKTTNGHKWSEWDRIPDSGFLSVPIRGSNLLLADLCPRYAKRKTQNPKPT